MDNMTQNIFGQIGIYDTKLRMLLPNV